MNSTTCVIEANPDVSGTGVTSSAAWRFRVNVTDFMPPPDPGINLRPLPRRHTRELLPPSLLTRRRPRRVLPQCIFRAGHARSSTALHSNIPDLPQRVDAFPRHLRGPPARSSGSQSHQQRPIRWIRSLASVVFCTHPSHRAGGFHCFQRISLGDGASFRQPALLQP